MNAVTKFITELDEKTESAKGDVIGLIKADHRKVDLLFAEYDSSKKASDKKVLLEQIVKELNIHAAAEEKLVYPSLKEHDKDGVNEAYEEHHVVEGVLSELLSVQEIDELVDAKVKVLSELVKHHVKEEEKTLLPEIKASGANLTELGAEFKAEKERLKSSPPKPGQANTNAKAFKKNH
jgi:hemerythrin superfamily protein